MAYSVVWPVSLPQKPQRGFTETFKRQTLVTPMDSGLSKRRTRSLGHSVLNVTYLLTKDQVEILNTFIHTTLQVTKRFGYLHPVLETMKEVRLLVESDELYTISYAAHDYYTVSLSLEVLP